MEKFKKGFCKTDKIIEERDRYIIVENGTGRFIVTEDGERRKMIPTLGGGFTFHPSLQQKALEGKYSLEDIS